VRGRLVEQSLEDEPAASFLKRLWAGYERDNARKSGKGASLFLPDQDAPFPCPANWAWVQLRTIGETQTGTTPPSGNPEFFGDYIPFVKPANLSDGAVNFLGEGISKAGIEYSRLIPQWSVLMVCIGGTLGKAAMTDRDVCCNQQINAITPHLTEMSPFTLVALRSSYFQRLAWLKAGIGTLPIISKGKWEQLPIPVPPLEEQNRIVTKLDELMALCDRLESAQRERDIGQEQFTASSHHHLTNGADGEATRLHAQFFINHLPRLTVRPDQIKRLRQTILKLAVTGRLVSQSASDEPASILIQRIQRSALAQVSLGAKSLARGPLQTSRGTNSNELPNSWIRTTTEMISILIVDCPHSTPAFRSEGVACLDTNSFKAGTLLPSRLRFVSEESFLERTKRAVPVAGDIVFAREGSIGESLIIPPGLRCCLGQRVMLFRLAEGIVPRYFQIAISDESFLKTLTAMHKGIGAKHVNVADMKRAVIPVPPAAEQGRIATRVDELMSLCDELEILLNKAQNEASRLLESVVHHALDSTAVKQIAQPTA
jgi:type I restriction enzyme, S subunit